MKIDGGCHCGQVRYQAEIDPEKVIICHCTDCQVMSGSAYRTVAFTAEDGFALLSGQLKTYIKIAESGNRRAMGFCPECGTHIYATDARDGPKVYGIRVGTADQRASLPPQSQKWCGSALDWVQDIGGLDKAG